MPRCYSEHSIQKDEALYEIAKEYQTSSWRILTANPDINPFLLQENQILTIPSEEEIISIIQPFDYETLQESIEQFKKIYPFLKFSVIGKSIDGRNIEAIEFGVGQNTVIYNGAHHGNEWITSLLLMKWLENMCMAYALRGTIRGYRIKNLFEHSRIIIVPMVNPDGVEMVIHGLQQISKKNLLPTTQESSQDSAFEKWKANLRGVDLNRNYDAGWVTYKMQEKALHYDQPGAQGYGGAKPFSEPETMAMTLLTLREDARLVLALHTQGKVIYWQFLNLTPKESYHMATELSKVSKYILEDEEEAASYAGYKDWFIQTLKKPGFTIEVGEGENPLPLEQFPNIYEENEELLILASIL